MEVLRPGALASIVFDRASSAGAGSESLMPLIHLDDCSGDWARTEIPDGGLALWRGASGDVELGSAPEDAPTRADAWVFPFVENGARYAALVVAPGVRDLFVGGRRPLDVIVLEERMEVVIGGARLYFTAREPLVIARYEGAASCGVCGEPVRDCDAIVCTGCAAVTHEGKLADGGERQCFEHRGSCPGCQLRREEFSWMPESDDA